MFTRKTATAALAALTLAATVAASTSAKAEHFGVGLGIGFAAGALIGAAAASSAYGGPAYVVGPSYRECRFVTRYDAWGNPRTVRICDIY